MKITQNVREYAKGLDAKESENLGANAMSTADIRKDINEMTEKSHKKSRQLYKEV